MMRCLACGRLPDETCCEKCHRAARLSTFGEDVPSKTIPPGQALRGKTGYSIRRVAGNVLRDDVVQR